MLDNLKSIYEENKKVILFIVSLILIVLLLVIIVKVTSNNKTPNIQSGEVIKTEIVLFGDLKITLEVGEEYVEPGFYAIVNNQLKTEDVKVINNVNTNKEGIYTITYILNDKKVTREVEVVKKEEDSVLTFSLNGDDIVTLDLGESYVEPGFYASDTKLGDLTSNVIVSGIVDTNKEGSYTLTYVVTNGSVSKELKRVIKVIDNRLNINITLDKTTYTKDNVLATINITGNNYAYLVLPNNIISKNKKTTYTIEKNGTFVFKAYRNDGSYELKEIVVNNIDKVKPTGACIATLNEASTTIIVSANDNLSGVKNYIYYDNTKLLQNTISKTYTHGISTSNKIYVEIYDKVLNYNKITCTIIDNSALKEITPNNYENIVFKEETNTLKVYISKFNNYYITRVWARNPYTQLNKYDSPEYGKTLYRPKKLLEDAIDKYNLDNKLLLGFNASGFYLKDTYDADSVSKYSGYDKTSVGTLVITNGKVVRNVYNKAYKTWFIAGIDKNNKLRLFTDSKASTTLEIKDKISWSEEVIDSGIRNTYTFASPLIENGKRSTNSINMPSSTSYKNRQAICQVNKNNFVLITGEDLNREDLINIMLDLNCETGTNLDGGGSIALLYKSKNSSSVETVIGNNRSLTEVAYFSEQ